MSNDRLDELRAGAAYAQERYRLYKAKAYGNQPTSDARLHELERANQQAQARLRFAEAEERRATADEGPGGPADI